MKKRTICFIITIVLLITSFNPACAKAVSSLANAKVQPMVSAGCNFSAVLMPDGTVWSFGVNELAEVGNGETSTSSKPTRVLGLSDIVQIDCASANTLALKRDGTVWGWGFNNMHGVSYGVPEKCYYAAKIPGIKDVKQVQAGDGMSVFLKKDGTVWYYEGNDNKTATLKQFKDLKDIVAISVQHIEGIALTKDGHVWTWGLDYVEDGVKINMPVKESISNIKAIDTGDFHYIVQKKDGSVWLWGSNGYGQVGNGTNDYCFTPVQLKGLKNIKLFATGLYFTMAVTKDGSYYAWGDNGSGQLGNNTRKSSNKPVKISGMNDVIAMDGGYNHTVAIKSNGDIVVMGYNNDGIIGTGKSDTKDKLKPFKLMNIWDKAYQTKTGTEIYPDGSLADWGKAVPVAKGVSSKKGASVVGIKALYARMDKKYLYIAASVTKGIPLDWKFRLEIDGDQKKDYQLNFTDTLYSCIVRYHFTDKGTEWEGEEYGVYSDVVEFRIALNTIGDPQAIRIMALYGADKKKYGVNSEITTWKEVQGSKKQSEASTGSDSGTASEKDYENTTENASENNSGTASGNSSGNNADSSEQMTPCVLGKITLDGEMDDWNNLQKTVIEDPEEEMASGKADIHTVYAAKDSDYLYVAVMVSKSTPTILMKFDTDNDGNVDYGANGDTVASEVYMFAFSSENSVKEIARSSNIAYHDVVEIVIPLKDIGNPSQVSIHLWSKHDNKDDDNTDDEIEGYFDVVNLN